MAGYQRHDFETTSVSPGSDGEWGAFARGFSNGHSMGRAISTAVNRRNISKANEDYQKDVEAANQQDIKTQEEMDPELKKAGVSDRAAIMTKSQLEKLSPEAQEYFKDYYRSQQLEGNTPQNRYDFATRKGMLDDAASRRKEAIQSSFLKHMGPEAYNEFRKNEAQANAAEYEDMRTQKKMAMRDFMNVANSNSPESFSAILSMGQKLGVPLPQGVQVDIRNGTFTVAGPKGKPQVQPLTAEAVQPYLDSIKMKMFEDIYADDMKQLAAAQNYQFGKDTYDARVEGENQKPALARSADARGWFSARETASHNQAMENLGGVALGTKGPKLPEDKMVPLPDGSSIPASYLGDSVDKDGTVLNEEAYNQGVKRYQQDRNFLLGLEKQTGIKGLSGVNPNLFKLYLQSLFRQQ